MKGGHNINKQNAWDTAYGNAEKHDGIIPGFLGITH